MLCVLVAFAIPGTARSEGSRWQWPTPAPHRVVGDFDAPETPYGPGHRGIDIAVAGQGADVRAVESGTVRFSGPVAGRGVVSVLHADGLISTYEPVTAVVEKGQPVQAGDVLGQISAGASSHCAGQLCLHLGARLGQAYLDPLLLLGGRGPSVLLPWADGATGGHNPSSGEVSTSAAAGPGTGEHSVAATPGATLLGARGGARIALYD